MLKKIITGCRARGPFVTFLCHSSFVIKILVDCSRVNFHLSKAPKDTHLFQKLIYEDQWPHCSQAHAHTQATPFHLRKVLEISFTCFSFAFSSNPKNIHNLSTTIE
jgi:hypothetical protein